MDEAIGVLGEIGEASRQIYIADDSYVSITMSKGVTEVNEDLVQAIKIKGQNMYKAKHLVRIDWWRRENPN